MSAQEVVQKIIDQILASVDSNSDDIDEAIREYADISQIAIDLFESDDEVQDALRKKVKSLLLKKIREDGSNEIESDIESRDIIDYMPDNFNIETILTQLFERDREIRDKVTQKVKNTLFDAIAAIDGNDLPDDENLIEQIDIENLVKKIIQEPEIEKTIFEKIKTVVRNYYNQECDWDENMPDDFWRNLDKQISQLLSDFTFKQQVEDMIKEVAKDEMQKYIQNRFDPTERMAENQEFANLVDRAVDVLFRDRDFAEKIQEMLTERLTTDPRLGERLMKAAFDKMADHLIERMFLRR